MKVFTVTGGTGSGKTTTIERLIAELKRRGFSVGTVKEIHNEQFKMDTPGKNTYRHRQAGADTVTALGYYETDVMYNYKMDIRRLLSHYTEDYVILEGVNYINAPGIAVAKERNELIINDLTFAVSGVITNTLSGEIDGLPLISAIEDISRLADLVIAKVPELMPDIDVKCCGECGMSCRQLLSEYLKGKADISRCVLEQNSVKLIIDGKEIEIAPFVDKVLFNTIDGIARELRGYRKCPKITLILSD
jgi:molybdopterin-guanine dinucleotide biosynthesis protein B